MENKFLKFIQSKKFLDIFCYIFCGIYLFFAVSFVLIDYSNKLGVERELQNLLAYTDSVNKRLEEEKKLIKPEDNENPPVEILFKDGKEAIISAYNKLYNADSFYIESTGSFQTTVAGVTAKAGMINKIIRFNKEKQYDEKINYFISASSFESFVKPQTNKAKRVLKEYGTAKVYETTKISGKKANFSSAKFYSSTTEPVLGENLYIVNEETIEKILYFKIKKDRKGNPVEYYVQAELNPKTALKDFANYMKFSSESLKTPVYTKFIATACIDKYGNLIGVSTVDHSIIVKNTPLGVKDCPCDVKLSFTISNINQNIDYDLGDF